MTWFLVLLLLINFSYNNADMFAQYSDEVKQTLFGDLSSMEDVLTAAKYTLEWNPNSTQSKDSSNWDWDSADRFDDEIKFTEPGDLDIDQASHDHAGQQYHKLSNEINIMRRYITLRYHREDKDDHDKGFFKIENAKRWMIRRCYLQFIIHTRYEVAKALIQREPLRNDKRYKIGYLFNRLRRIRTEEMKMLYYIHDRIRHRELLDHQWFWHMNVFYVEDTFMTHLMIYERLTQYDVDLKDTIYLIKEIYAEKAPYDMVDEDDDSEPIVPTRKTTKAPAVNTTLPQLSPEMLSSGMWAGFLGRK